MNNQEAVQMVKEAWLKEIEEEIKELELEDLDNEELELEDLDNEELSEDIIDQMKLKKQVLKCKSLQEIISLQRADCWDKGSSASFIVKCLSGEEVEFGGGWST